VSYPYVAIDVPEDEADEAAELLFELGTSGVERRDATTLARGADSGKVTLVASFTREEDARAAIRDLSPAWSPRFDRVIGDAWRDEWKKHFEPFRIAGAIVVCPPWRQYEAKVGESVVVLEPGRAFGTGLHETTSLVAQVLCDHAACFRGRRVLDVGCGSGILSLVSLALGAAGARAIDVDPEAVEVTRENAARNGMGERLSADEARVEAVAGDYAAVVANIEAKTLVEIAPALVERVAPGGLLVLSGILARGGSPGVPAQVDDVHRAYAGIAHAEVRTKGEWAAVVLRG
jgi:ribosomal protein L11 methyltransferase